MYYRTTRGGSKHVSFEDAVLKGLGSDGGLFIPETIPQLPENWQQDWVDKTFEDIAFEIMKLYIDENEISRADLRGLIDRSYKTFRAPERTPLTKLIPEQNIFLLELFHGPTYAFKDVALQFLGNLFEYFINRKNAELKSADKEPFQLVVIGATSGDTGSAAIYGLRGKENISIFVLHPRGRISEIQEAQMTSVLDENVHNLAVEGSFDDCQNIVKAIFADSEMNNLFSLGAVNSINWARILAQITYYIFGYLQLKKYGKLQDSIVRFVVPTGNFGNILAGYYAKQMGVPILKLMAATNVNDILHRFFTTGVYKKATDSTENKDSGNRYVVKQSYSPAMDILISSNFERFLWYLMYETYGMSNEKACKMVKEKMDMIADGGFEVSEETLDLALKIFSSGRCTDEETLQTIAKVYDQETILIDPHTAVGVFVATSLTKKEQEEDPGCNSVTVCLSTAHPGKFEDAIEKALADKPGVNRDLIIPKELGDLIAKRKRLQMISSPDAALVKDVIKATMAKSQK